MTGGRATLLALAPWPGQDGVEDIEAEAEIGWVIDLVTAVRSVRVEMNVPPAAYIPLVLVGAKQDAQRRAERWAEFINRLARLSAITFAATTPRGAVQLVVRGEAAAIPLAGVINIAAERTRLSKELAKADADISRVDGKLANPDFLARAPEEVVEGEREKREEAAARRAKLAEAFERLKAAEA